MRKFIPLACLFLVLPILVADAGDITMTVTPSLRIAEEWDSNVGDVSDNEEDSFGTRVTPGLAVEFLSQDNVRLTISGSYDRIWYHDSAVSDENDEATWNVRTESSGAWRLTPTFSFRPSIFFVTSADYASRVRSIPVGDPVLSDVSITNFGRTKTQEFGGGVSFEYFVSPRVVLGLHGSYSDLHFKADDEATFAGTDSTNAGGGLTLSYLVTERTSVGLTGSRMYQTYEDDSPDTDTWTAGLRFGHQFTPALRLDATAGWSWIRREEAAGQPEETDSAPTGDISLAYTTDAYRVRLFGNTSYSAGSGTGESEYQSTVGIDFTQALAERWSWNVTGAFQIRESAFDDEVVQRYNTTFVNAGVRYQVLSWLALDLTGEAQFQDAERSAELDLNNYIVRFGIVASNTWLVF